MANVYAVEDHAINCYLSDIPAQIDDVIWSPPTMVTDGYSLEDWNFDPETKSQVSTLIVSASQLLELKGYAKSHVFACKITVASNDWPVSAVQTITIFNPSKNVFA